VASRAGHGIVGKKMKISYSSCENNPDSSDIQPTASPLHKLGYRAPTKNTNAITITAIIIIIKAFLFSISTLLIKIKNK
jgi:hypothetical protein